LKSERLSGRGAVPATVCSPPSTAAAIPTAASWGSAADRDPTETSAQDSDLQIEAERTKRRR
jgi:hypothetical protein